MANHGQHRGRHLFRTRDVNAPATGRRPDPRFQLVQVVEAQGHSWYRGLQVGLVKRHARHHSYSLAYTWSRAERDTEEFDFTPQDQDNPDAERGPSTSDVRHQLAMSGAVDLPFGMQLGVVSIASTGVPYNVTLGYDANGDGTNNDRPAGYGRNSERGGNIFELDARLAKSIKFGSQEWTVSAEAFNLTNRANWTVYDGVYLSPTFGQPTGARIARQLQLGVRVRF